MDCPLVFVNLSEAAANLKRRPIEVIKIELRKRNVWCYFRKISYFDMQIILAIPPIFHFRRWLWEFFFSFIKGTKLLSLCQSIC